MKSLQDFLKKLNQYLLKMKIYQKSVKEMNKVKYLLFQMRDQNSLRLPENHILNHIKNLMCIMRKNFPFDIKKIFLKDTCKIKTKDNQENIFRKVKVDIVTEIISQHKEIKVEVR